MEGKLDCRSSAQLFTGTPFSLLPIGLLPTVMFIIMITSVLFAYIIQQNTYRVGIFIMAKLGKSLRSSIHVFL